MKQYIIYLIILSSSLLWCTESYGQLPGETRDNALILGPYSNNFQFTDTKDTRNYTMGAFGYALPGNKIFYRLNTSQTMDVTISLCGSQISDTHIYLMYSNYDNYILAENNNSDHCGTGSLKSYLSMPALPAGSYLLICKGNYMNGEISLQINGTSATVTPPSSTPGDIFSNPFAAGTFNSSFSYSDTKNTNNFTNQYTGRSTNDVFYKFTTTQPMDVELSLCGSELYDTFLHLLDASGNRITYCDDYCGYQSYLSMPTLAAGTYYVVCEGYSQNGNISIQVNGTVTAPPSPVGDKLSDPIVMGTFNLNFSYSDIKNTNNYTNQYNGQGTNDVFYKFTTTQPMNVELSLCGSELYDTFLHLLDASGNRITYCDDYCGYQSYLSMPTLAAGTYYAVCEGYSQNGNISIQVNGTVPAPPSPVGDKFSDPIAAGTFSTNFSYSDSKNTNNFTNQHPGISTSDVFYRFTTTQTMDASLSLCGSEISDTYLYLLNSSGTAISYNDNSIDCGNGSLSYLTMNSLAPGTYYAVCKGKMTNGGISILIEGTVPVTISSVSASASKNYIWTFMATTAVTNSQDLTASNSLQSISYFDGLGRPIQSVQAGITPGRKDLISIQGYDPLGRESKTWLPVAKSGNSGSFREINSALESEIKVQYGNDNHPYSETGYEASPLNRVAKVEGPGQDWVTNSRAVKTDFMTNNAITELKCRRYFVDGETLKKDASDYAAGQLFVTRITDEDNNISYEFKDKEGKVVLQRQVNPNVGESEKYLDTYFAYDDFGNLHYVLPPLTSDLCASGISTDAVDKYAFVYKYDHRMRCTGKKLPGAGWSSMVYDHSDRLILKQDAVQQLTNKWTFYIYDPLGRLVMEGEKTIASTAQSLSDTYRNKWIVATYISSGVHGYGTLSDLPATESEVYTVNYYDRDYIATDLGFQSNGYDANFSSSKGLLTWCKTKVLDTNNYIQSSVFYDFKGNVVQKHSKNFAGGYDREYFKYSFTNQVKERYSQHMPYPATGTIYEKYLYEYDHAGRLLNKKHAINNATPVLMAAYTYDELGRLLNKNTASIEKDTMSYNIRGWMTAKNGKMFTEKLFYNQAAAGGIGYFNGNIHDQWTKGGTSILFDPYTFTYDPLNRLIQASFSKPNATGGYNESMTYDKHGNIKTLQRYGLADYNAFVPIDNLSFIYNGNQLANVTEVSGNQSGNSLMEFKRSASGNHALTYDLNGRITSDLSKNISSIQYNVVNLPKRVVQSSGNSIDYLYDASGVKLQTKHTAPATTALKREYIGNKVYENGVLKLILTEEGYIANESGVYKSYFYLKDHLGNNRVVLDQVGAVAQLTNYYPFGASFAENEVPRRTDQDKQPYKYNGKELDRLYGVNWYDYSARFYDPITCRFMTMDPLAEKNYSVSPYAYCKNDPVNRIDPDGRDDYYTNEGRFLYRDNKKTDEIRVINNYADQVYKQSAGKSSGKVDYSKLESVGFGDADLSAKAYSNIFTDVLSKMEDVDMKELHNEKVSVTVFGENEEVTNRYNSGTKDYNQTASEQSESGKSLVTATIKTGSKDDNRSLYSTVSNVQNMLGAHELIGHGVKGWGNATKTHYQVYEFQMAHPSWTKTTPQFKTFMNRAYQNYLNPKR